MKHLYQFLTVILAALVITACGDKPNLKADATALENIVEKGEQIKNTYTLLNQLPILPTAEERAATAKKVAEEAAALKNSITALKLTSEQGKALQAKFEKNFAQLTDLANQLSQYATTPATPEQQVSFGKLLQEVSSGLQQSAQELQQTKATAEQAK